MSISPRRVLIKLYMCIRLEEDTTFGFLDIEAEK